MVGYGLFESVIVFFICLGVEKKLIISFVIFFKSYRFLTAFGAIIVIFLDFLRVKRSC